MRACFGKVKTNPAPMKKVYLDNAATTPLVDEVIEAMMAVLKNTYGNPSSIHSLGQEARTVIEGARRLIADELKVTPGEIVFTSCGTEANNLILKSSVKDLGVTRVISSPLEHKCVAETCQELAKNGTEVILLNVNEKGDVDLAQLEELLKTSDAKTLVSLMHANNEIGNLLDLKKVSALCKQYNALFHSDTVQTMAHLRLDFSEIPLDFASCSAHKFHGPKGAGFAFIRKSAGIKAQIHGGEQERRMRAGTENIAGIAGMAKAFEIATHNLDKFATHTQEVKAYALQQLKENVPDIEFNGRCAEPENSLFTIISALVPGNNPLIGLMLDMKGIAISQGSACSSGASKPSSVLSYILSPEKLENASPLRISFSHLTTKEEIDALAHALEELVAVPK